MTPDKPQLALPQLPTDVPMPPVFGQQPAGRKPGAKSITPTFLGSAMRPTTGQLGNKQLVGQ